MVRIFFAAIQLSHHACHMTLDWLTHYQLWRKCRWFRPQFLHVYLEKFGVRLSRCRFKVDLLTCLTWRLDSWLRNMVRLNYFILDSVLPLIISWQTRFGAPVDSPLLSSPQLFLSPETTMQAGVLSLHRCLCSYRALAARRCVGNPVKHT